LEDEEEQRNEERGKLARERNCDPKLPNLSVGDFNITIENFDQVKKDNEVMVIGMSD